MGFIKAAIDSAKAGFANQWLEYMTVPEGFDGQALVGRAVPVRKDGSANNDGQEDVNIISDGSNFEVPENTALVLVENGGITAVIAEPGRYTYTSQNVPEAKSMFAGDGFFASTFGQSWQQFKFGGQPSNKQVAFYVNLRPIAGLAYGTTNKIRYEDSKYGADLAVTSHGTFTVKVVDPLLLIKNLVDASFLTATTGRKVFSLKDMDSEGRTVEDSLFSGFIGSLNAALSRYSQGGKNIKDIQGGTVEFAKDMNVAVENNYHWGTLYGLQIVTVEPRSLDWDEESEALVAEYNKKYMSGKADAAVMGAIGQEMAKDGGRVGAAYSQATIAQGFKAAGENGGAQGMFGIGMAMNQMGGGAGLLNPVGGPAAPAAPAEAPAPAPVAPAAPAAEPAAEPAAPAAEPEAPAAPAVDTSNMSDDDIAAMRAAGIDPTAQ